MNSTTAPKYHDDLDGNRRFSACRGQVDAPQVVEHQIAWCAFAAEFSALNLQRLKRRGRAVQKDELTAGRFGRLAEYRAERGSKNQRTNRHQQRTEVTQRHVLILLAHPTDIILRCRPESSCNTAR